MVLIFGLGSYPSGSGSSAALYLAKQGKQLVVTDLKPAEQLHQPTLKKLQRFKNVTLVLGRHRKSDIKQAEYIVRNPGVPDNEYIRYAHALGKMIVNDVGIFLTAVQKRFSGANVQMIGITGTRGKSTTTALITAILRKQFGDKRVHIGGNIGNSPLNFLSKIQPNDFVVLELSSWLLRDLHQSQFTIAVVTNVLPDHLNYYTSMQLYQADKERIFLGQTVQHHAVLNSHDRRVRTMAKITQATVHYFEPKKIAGVKILGEHNQANIGAAWTVGQIFKIPVATMRQAIQAFPGVPNRLERIRMYRGRKFYNDTTATTPDATIAALKSFKKKVILISGGNTKNLPLHKMVQAIKQRVKILIVLPGNANNELPGGLAVNTMQQAVRLAWQLSKVGDVILLSPGLSWLPVMHEFERGKQFVKAVQRIV